MVMGIESRNHDFGTKNRGGAHLGGMKGAGRDSWSATKEMGTNSRFLIASPTFHDNQNQDPHTIPLAFVKDFDIFISTKFCSTGFPFSKVTIPR